MAKTQFTPSPLEDCTEGYSPQLLAVLWFGIKAIAVEWIDVNCPQAWYRSMFTDEPLPDLKEEPPCEPK